MAIAQFKFKASSDIDVAIKRGATEPCANHPFGLMFAGHGETDDNARWTVQLPNISCVSPVPGGDFRSSFVVTPFVVNPPPGGAAFVPRKVVMEVVFDGANNNHVIVRSFELNGAQAPHVQFSWIMVVPGTPVVD